LKTLAFGRDFKNVRLPIFTVFSEFPFS